MLKWKIPVNVITGYLGSGKTTLLRRIMESTGSRIAILMNEFGEVGVDTKTVSGKNIEIKELLGGCVCCSLTGDFFEAIKEIIERVSPERIIIETTGVAEPDAIIVNLTGMDAVALDSVVCVVDSDALARFPSIGHTGRVQIENADFILINKADLVDARKIEEVREAVLQINPDATVVVATHSNVDPSAFFGLATKREASLHEEHNLDVVQSFVYRSDRVHGRAEFSEFVSKIPKEVYRAKGYIVFPDGAYLFNLVAGRHELVKEGGGPTEIVFIGEGIGGLEGEVVQSLRACEI
ncbi:MAG: GTP-binding protein [Candidatus Aenigmarchaeota archaeon]|nr:GTP-binding protein [Candidatus Aenigmarchaeota archaeon]